MNKLLFTFLFVLVGTLAQAQGHTSTNDGTPGSADNHEAAATSGHRVNAAKGTGKLTVIDATQGGLRVVSGDGTGRGNWVSGSSPTVVNGSLPANWVTLTRHNFLPRFVYAGMSITLTPGNWLVYVNAT